MKEKNEELKEVMNKLNDENKDIMLLLAKGMQIAQNTKTA